MTLLSAQYAYITAASRILLGIENCTKVKFVRIHTKPWNARIPNSRLRVSIFMHRSKEASRDSGGN